MKNGLGFKLFKGYVRFFHDVLYYKRHHWLDTENIPEKGPLMIVSDHQNSLNDALAILMAIDKRKEKKLRIVARADVFKPWGKKALDWLGMLPAFRLSYEGEESLANNEGTFSEAEVELNNDGTLIIYPEAGHQDKHWLGKFSLGYLRMLFQAAEKNNFEKELFILPSCNHYSNYFDIQEDVLIRFGTPISIAPFYELYKTKPRTAQRQVNELVREQISAMMLNITDLENYEAIDFLRRNTFGIDYAKERGFDPDKLPEKLLADKQLFADLEQLKETDEEKIHTIYDNVGKLEEKIKELKLKETDFSRKESLPRLMAKGVLLALLLPLFLFACIPNIIIYYVPNIFISRINDKMFYGCFRLAISILITIPILYPLTALLTWFITKSMLIALIHLVCLPFLAIFAWRYAKGFMQWITDLRFNRLFKRGGLNHVIELRSSIYESINRLVRKAKIEK